MNSIFPYDNLIVGILILIVGFIFHWLGQLLSALNWELAVKIGLQESKMPKEYRVYEHAIAVADSCIGWIYGVAAFGLIFNLSWGFKLAWIPGTILIYHGVSYWFWTKNRNKDKNQLESSTMRIGWTVANLLTGLLAVLLAYSTT